MALVAGDTDHPPLTAFIAEITSKRENVLCGRQSAANSFATSAGLLDINAAQKILDAACKDGAGQPVPPVSHGEQGYIFKRHAFEDIAVDFVKHQIDGRISRFETAHDIATVFRDYCSLKKIDHKRFTDDAISTQLLERGFATLAVSAHASGMAYQIVVPSKRAKVMHSAAAR
jgi:hypothetical protein